MLPFSSMISEEVVDLLQTQAVLRHNSDPTYIIIANLYSEHEDFDISVNQHIMHESHIRKMRYHC